MKVDKKYCFYCQTELKTKNIEGRDRLYCKSCKLVIYENPIPSTGIVLINKKEEILLVKRAVPPSVGEWCLPGGFLEIDENVLQCSIRELKEETGLSGLNPFEFGSFLSRNPFYKSVLVVGILMGDYRGWLKAGDDAQEAAFFPFDQKPKLAFKSHEELFKQGLKVWQKNYRENSLSRHKLLNIDCFGAYVITSNEHVKIAAEACAGGAKVVQYRDKNTSKRKIMEHSKEIRRITNEYKSCFIINDYIDIALSVGADGIHLGQDDLPITAARKIVGPDVIIGISTHSLEQALSAVKSGADYIGCGPLYQTPTKADYTPVGLDLIKEVLRKVSIPVVAIGGITLERIKILKQAGIKNFAMVRGYQKNTKQVVEYINSL